MIYLKDNKTTLINGDCLEELPSFKNIDLIFADPPFNLGKEFDVPMTNEEYYSWCEKWINLCWDVLSQHGSFLLMTIQEHSGAMMEIMRKRGCFRNLIVWRNSSMPIKNRFCLAYQPILYYVKDIKNYTFNYGQEQRHSTAAIPWGRENNAHSLTDIWDDIPFVSGGCMASREAIMAPGTKKKLHSAQMPTKLSDRIIKYCSNEEETVLDPFAGSGTTLVSARSLNRIGIGIEKNDEYCKLIKDRIEHPETLSLGKDSRGRKSQHDFDEYD